MKYGELIRKLRKLGVEFRRQAKGSHEVWGNRRTGRYTLIPNHAGKDIKSRTLRQILKDLGLSEEDLKG